MKTLVWPEPDIPQQSNVFVMSSKKKSLNDMYKTMFWEADGWRSSSAVYPQKHCLKKILKNLFRYLTNRQVWTIFPQPIWKTVLDSPAKPFGYWRIWNYRWLFSCQIKCGVSYSEQHKKNGCSSFLRYHFFSSLVLLYTYRIKQILRPQTKEVYLSAFGTGKQKGGNPI